MKTWRELALEWAGMVTKRGGEYRLVVHPDLREDAVKAVDYLFEWGMLDQGGHVTIVCDDSLRSGTSRWEGFDPNREKQKAEADCRRLLGREDPFDALFRMHTSLQPVAASVQMSEESARDLVTLHRATHPAYAREVEQLLEEVGRW
jgi:hypothetical protein